jgi:hypothetical protein
VKHGIDEFGDGPTAFTSPAIVNTIYGRWWHPLDEKPGPNPVPDSPLPWTGDFMTAWATRSRCWPTPTRPTSADERQRADGYGIVRFDKRNRRITFECWPRFSDVQEGDKAQFPGWPLTIDMDANDGRKPVAWLPEFVFSGAQDPVVQVIEQMSGEVLYTRRVSGDRFQPPVFAAGQYAVKIGRDRPDRFSRSDVTAGPRNAAPPIPVDLG